MTRHPVADLMPPADPSAAGEPEAPILDRLERVRPVRPDRRLQLATLPAIIVIVVAGTVLAWSAVGHGVQAPGTLDPSAPASLSASLANGSPTPRSETSPVGLLVPGTIGRAARSLNLLESGVSVQPGQIVYIVSGPTEHGGRLAYRVQHWGDLTTGLRPDTVFDWADADALAASLRPYSPQCPAESTRARDVAGLQPFERLACFDGRTLTLGPVTPREYDIGGSDGTPAWLAASSTIWLTDDGRPDFPTAIPIHVDPQSGIELAAENWYEVSGRFDHPAAAGCSRRAAAPDLPGDAPAPALADLPDEQVLWCREQFVIEAAQMVDPPSSVLRGAWRRIAPAPIAGKAEYAAAWTGRELLVWGGRSDDPSAGAAYDPARDRWRRIAPAPIPPRSSPAVAWTGGEFVVWGGWSDSGAQSDGAAYDPAADRWRKLPPSPLAATENTRAVWTGADVVVVTGEPAAAAWDPATDHWRLLAVPPLPAGWLEFVGTSAGPIGLGFGPGTSAPIVAVLLDPERGFWRTIASPPYDASTMGAAALAAGGTLIFGAASYNPVTDTWLTLATEGCAHRMPEAGVWSGQFLVAQDEAFDPEAGLCLQVPPAPNRNVDGVDTATHEGATPVWTGDEYIVWSGMTGGDGGSIPNDGVAFRPNP